MDTGKVSENVLKRSVLKYVQQNNKFTCNACHLLQEAKIGADSALFAISEPASNKMGSATAAAIGRHRMVVVEALINACNNLICGGAEAFGVEINLILPEALYESELRHMMEEAVQYANKHHITILGGNTIVSQYVTETIANITAIGYASESHREVPRAGMDVVMTKWIGLQGTSHITASHKEELEKRLPIRMIREAEEYRQYMSIVPEARIAEAFGISFMHDVSGGGIFRALWEVSELAETGIRIDLKKIPVKQHTIEVCEVFGLNPYELLGGGALLIVTANGEELAEKLMRENIPAAVIGRLTDNNDKVIVTYSEEGEELRFLDRPRTDEINKL